MNVLVVGGGGREHALAWALSKNATVFAAPGNPGTATCGTNLPVSANDQSGIVRAVEEHAIDLTVIGPEAPLAAGMVDALEAAGHRAFGPSARAARIESSKAYAKEVMRAAGVATAASATFTDESQALAFIANHAEPLVVKASGLAAGKGVIVCPTRGEARAAATAMFQGEFGEAGHTVVVEDFLCGEELSVLALTDGERVMLLPTSQDHKRLGEGDTGPNTGGMGAYAPVSVARPALLERVESDILAPVLAQLAADGAPYRGVLYAGIMILEDGSPSVLEFNCRFGDPETQVVLPALDEDLSEHLWRIAAREPWRPEPSAATAARAAVTTVLAAQGYPAAPKKGAEVHHPSTLAPHTLLFHAGTARDRAGRLTVAGGRVLCATGTGASVPEAAARSRALAEQVRFDGRQFRRDIAWRETRRAGAA
jgi:phosphoribosylamine--glycine ligase